MLYLISWSVISLVEFIGIANPTPSTPDNKDDANVPSTGTDSSEKAPAAQTGDTMHAVPFALAMIISAGVVVIEISRKKKAVR